MPSPEDIGKDQPYHTQTMFANMQPSPFVTTPSFHDVQSRLFGCVHQHVYVFNIPLTTERTVTVHRDFYRNVFLTKGPDPDFRADPNEDSHAYVTRDIACITLLCQHWSLSQPRYCYKQILHQGTVRA